MSKARHTPGPWRPYTADTGVTEILHRTGEKICGVKVSEMVCHFGFHPDRARGGIDYTRVWANARLIAAAPDMLEALEEAYEYLECMISDIDGSPDYDGEHPLLTKCRAAIAKARGGSHE